jgi:hypothetical protein
VSAIPEGKVSKGDRERARDGRAACAEVVCRRELKLGGDIPELFMWHFDQLGLTDLTDQTEGDRRYIVFMDTHS